MMAKIAFIYCLIIFDQYDIHLPFRCAGRSAAH
jgi:hypothetical protein